MLHFPAHYGEQIQLSFQIAAGVGLDALEDALYCLYHAVAVGAKTIKGTGFDQAFHRAAVQLTAVHPLAEIIKACVGLFLTLGDCVFDEVAAYVFTAFSPKRICPLSSAVKPPLEMFTSGGRTLMPRRAHSPEYSMTLSVLSSTLVSSAAMNWLG